MDRVLRCFLFILFFFLLLDKIYELTVKFAILLSQAKSVLQLFFIFPGNK